MLNEIIHIIDELKSCNLGNKSSLRTLVGKCSHAAMTVATWRPFLQDLWTALHHSASGSSAPDNFVWFKHIKVACEWISAFVSTRARRRREPCPAQTAAAWRGESPSG